MRQCVPTPKTILFNQNPSQQTYPLFAIPQANSWACSMSARFDQKYELHFNYFISSQFLLLTHIYTISQISSCVYLTAELFVGCLVIIRAKKRPMKKVAPNSKDIRCEQTVFKGLSIDQVRAYEGSSMQSAPYSQNQPKYGRCIHYINSNMSGQPHLMLNPAFQKLANQKMQIIIYGIFLGEMH